MSAAVELVPAVGTLGRGLEHAGVISVSILAATAVLLTGRGRFQRARVAAMLAALVLTPVLLVGDIWDSPQLRPLRHHPALGAAMVVAVLAVVAALTELSRRRPSAFPVLAVAALPFRIPISSGGTTSNLLVPLYLVVAAGVLAGAFPRGERRARDASPLSTPRVGRLETLLMASVVLYAAQTLYTADFTKALEQVVFFYVPFSLLFVLLREQAWTPRLLAICLAVLVGLSMAFVAIGFVEYSRRELLLNPKVIAANQVQTYFRVNSLFFDPNIYGRFLALVMTAVSAVLLSLRKRRDIILAGIVLALLWGGLVLSFSESSIGGLLLGLAVLGALRISLRDTMVASLAALLLGVALLLAVPNTVHVHLGSSQGANNSTSGRYTLVKGGVDLFGQRPLQGWGPAAFPLEYRRHENASSEGAVSASHTTPLTVAAEQGVGGLVLYALLLAAAFARLFAGARASPARMALAAAFAGLVLHTLFYAAFLEDPLSWTLLGIGAALAVRPSGVQPAPGAPTPVVGDPPSPAAVA